MTEIKLSGACLNKKEKKIIGAQFLMSSTIVPTEKEKNLRCAISTFEPHSRFRRTPFNVLHFHKPRSSSFSEILYDVLLEHMTYRHFVFGHVEIIALNCRQPTAPVSFASAMQHAEYQSVNALGWTQREKTNLDIAWMETATRNNITKSEYVNCHQC